MECQICRGRRVAYRFRHRRARMECPWGRILLTWCHRVELVDVAIGRTSPMLFRDKTRCWGVRCFDVHGLICKTNRLDAGALVQICIRMSSHTRFRSDGRK
jgi:hypothetical protein